MTNFSDFLNNAWSDHVTKTIEVSNRFPAALKLIEKNEQIPSLAGIITHVMGEHLGEWNRGIVMLKQLPELPAYDGASESQWAVARSIASLEIAGSLRQSLEEFSLSNQIRILAVAASALSEKDAVRAQSLFLSAIEKTEKGMSKDDPANRALAVTGNNLACSLEEKKDRSPAETDLMILAAKTCRHYWEIAGTWLEVERAEYRLANTYLKAGKAELALEHAKKCIEVSRNSSAAALELFFGYEILALVEKFCGNAEAFEGAVKNANLYFSQLSDDDKSWCESSLKKLSS